VKREKAKLTEMTASRQGLKSLARLITEVNRHLKGWMNYFRLVILVGCFRRSVTTRAAA
jgi:group II intron maturase